MMAFPTRFLEFAFKRGWLRRQEGFRGDAWLLTIVRSVLGECRVNFDAEALGERPEPAELYALCGLGAMFSETYQACRRDWGYLESLCEIYGRAGWFGLNFVLGNARYGCTPRFSWLEEAVSWFASRYGCCSDRVKVGVEGLRLGSKILGLCGRLGFTAYVLNTPWMGRLVGDAVGLGVRCVVYTPVRVSRSGGAALGELLGIMGYGYFERRGIGRDDVGRLASGYTLYGSPCEVASRLSEWLEMGVEGVVLSPVFQGVGDLVGQLESIKRVFELVRA